MHNINIKQHWCKSITFTSPNQTEQRSKDDLEKQTTKVSQKLVKKVQNKPKKVTEACTRYFLTPEANKDKRSIDAIELENKVNQNDTKHHQKKETQPCTKILKTHSLECRSKQTTRKAQ